MRTAIIGLTVVLTAFMGTLTVAAQHHQWSTSRPDTRTLRPSTLQVPQTVCTVPTSVTARSACTTSDGSPRG